MKIVQNKSQFEKREGYKAYCEKEGKEFNPEPKEGGGDYTRWENMSFGSGSAKNPVEVPLGSNNQTSKISFRIIPSHPVLNPHGVFYTVNYGLYDKSTGRRSFYLSPLSNSYDEVSYDEEAKKCAFTQAIAEFDKLLREKSEKGTEFREWLDSIPSMEDVKKNPGRYDSEQKNDAQFKAHYEEFIKPMSQLNWPVLAYATCDEIKDGNYTKFNNYKSDKKNMLPRILKTGTTVFAKEWMSKLKDVVDEDGDVEFAINDHENGRNVQLLREVDNKKVGYKHTYGDKSPFPQEWMEKLFPEGIDGPVSDKHYPNFKERIIDSKLTGGFYQEHMNALRASTLGEKLAEWGLLKDSIAEDEIPF